MCLVSDAALWGRDAEVHPDSSIVAASARTSVLITSLDASPIGAVSSLTRWRREGPFLGEHPDVEIEGLEGRRGDLPT